MAVALTGRKRAVRLRFSGEGLVVNSLHSRFMHISWASSIPTEWQGLPRMLTVNPNEQGLQLEWLAYRLEVGVSAFDILVYQMQ